MTSRINEPGFGLLIDRTRSLTFMFDGKLFNGFAGDVIASALHAEGQVLLSRSFKYHRPRGALTMAGHDANTLVQVADEPNVRADLHPVSSGLAVKSVNWLGSLENDAYAIIDKFSRFLPVGFYYKTFYWPNRSWWFYERPIREMAGLGKLDPRAGHRYYDKEYLFADVLVVGGGPAGLAAAIAAAESGADTLLVDEGPLLGGSLLYGRMAENRGAANETRERLVATARSLPNLTIMTKAVVSGLFADNWASIITGNRLCKVRARQTIVAAGSFDQPLVFRNNDRPGIMFASAAQRLMRLYGVKVGDKAVVVTSNALGYAAALDLSEAGTAITAVVDLGAVDGPEVEAVRAKGIRIIPRATVVDAGGKLRVDGVAVARLNDSGAASEMIEWMSCDTVLMSVGFQPAMNLSSHAGAKVVYDPATAMHRATSLPDGVHLAGSAAGLWSPDIVHEEATRTGRLAADLALGRPAGGAALRTEAVSDPMAARITHPYPIFKSGKGKEFIDFDEDLTIKDIVNSVKDGYDDIQLVKRYSTAGLGPSQGRHANLNTIRVVGKATGKALEEIGTTTFRPPLVPEKFAHMAGRAFEPKRLTAMHRRHVELGAQFMTAGLWMRPAYYGAKDDAQRAIDAEVKAVREAAGLIDVSTLGGLDIRGREAAAFIDRMYTWAYEKQPVGRARYALMTDMSGVLIDDGVACRLHERHFYVTATTSAVDQVYRAMSWYNTQWKMDVDVANVTAAWAGMNLAGPSAREIITKLATDIDFSKDAFPYMGCRTGVLAGVPVRILRVGFVGELGYEIHCPAGMGEALWDAIMAAGQPLGLKPFGVEAQRVLRCEKGHIIVGQDTDGLTNPVEANLAWAIGRKKPFFVGKRSIELLEKKGITRRLVGFEISDTTSPQPKECHLVIRDGAIAGRVTSVIRSPSLGKVVGLAYLPIDMTENGNIFHIRADFGAMVEARVVSTPFYDPENARQEL
ncbi:MAG: 2Fe-2S iron-sulfur cluster-binding protein [Hyphomicrobium sp.]|nr:2Fe-2S iron-sulfur cluster-binding protein [Hyphomicrobium sp.]